MGYGEDSSGSGQRPVAGSCEHCKEHAGSMKCLSFLNSWGIVGFSRTLLHGVSSVT
jgi:hypothetical protein